MQYKNNKKKVISPRVPDDIIKKLKEMSKKHGLSQNQIIERALGRELKILEQMEEPII
ncbi:MAG: ribbon-helix-helix protein, CopG family [Candidatus Heimdallarchaeota archaeon]